MGGGGGVDGEGGSTLGVLPSEIFERSRSLRNVFDLSIEIFESCKGKKDKSKSLPESPVMMCYSKTRQTQPGNHPVIIRERKSLKFVHYILNKLKLTFVPRAILSHLTCMLAGNWKGFVF